MYVRQPRPVPRAGLVIKPVFLPELTQMVSSRFQGGGLQWGIGRSVGMVPRILRPLIWFRGGDDSTNPVFLLHYRVLLST